MNTQTEPITTVSVQPPSIIGPPPDICNNFTINIHVSNVPPEGLWSWQAGMTFNPDVLECLRFDYNFSWFGPVADILTVRGTIDNTLGVITAHAATHTSAAPTVGNGTVAHITFHVKNYGQSVLKLKDVILCNLTGVEPIEIPFELVDGYFELPPPHGPTAIKTHAPLNPRVNQTVTFNASDSLPGWNTTHLIPIANYTWDFGDGNITTVTTNTIYHKYGAAGTYTVNLTVTCKYDPLLAGLGLLSNSTWQDITVYPPPPSGPTAIKTHEPILYPRVNQTVTFNASDSLPGWNTTHLIPIANYTWDFGDGNITTEADPLINHTYKAAGLYTVNLTVTCEYDPVLAGLGLLSNSTWQEITIYTALYWYWKTNYTDYAPYGVPDFDQRQGEWRNPYPPIGTWSWCGPTAVANSLWWLDSRYEVLYVPPPTISDTFPLVQAYGPWDDHDPRNVKPLIEKLAWYMDTDGIRTGVPHCGTEVYDMEYGINSYLAGKGIGNLLYAETLKAPTFWEVVNEVERCEDVVLLLGFWQWNGTGWMRVGGHFVTVAGLNPGEMLIGLCDPILDRAELGGSGRVFPGPHLPGHTLVTHNNASYASQDIYIAGSSSSPGGVWELSDYPAYMIIYDVGENLPKDFKSYSGKYNYTLPIFTEVEYAVITSPKGPIIHDVAVTGVTLSKTLVGTGYDVNIYAVAENQGNLTESFTITLFYNGNSIGTQPVTLHPGAKTTLKFTWDTKGVPKNLTGYTITANASIVPGETDIADNTYVDGTVKVTVPGDVNGDGKANVIDLGTLGAHWLAKVGDPRYKANVDVNGDGAINIIDLGILGLHWQQDP